MVTAPAHGRAAGGRQAPHNQASRPERSAALSALLLTFGILVLRPFSLLKKAREDTSKLCTRGKKVELGEKAGWIGR